jgi:hypothetical protein
LIVLVEIRLAAELSLLLLFEVELEDDDAVRATTPYLMSLSAACIDQQSSSSLLLRPLSSLQLDGSATDIDSVSISAAVVTSVADAVVMRRLLDIFVSGSCCIASFLRQNEMIEIELDERAEVIDDGRMKNE